MTSSPLTTKTASAPNGLRLLATLIPLIVGLALVAPHLADEVWYDESYTLLNFSQPDVTTAFIQYAPNNHLLFSAALGVWQRWLPDIFIPRFLPLGCFALSLGLLVVTVRRVVGLPAAVVGGLLFATAHVTQNFAVQLRGYGVSWMFVIAVLYALIRLGESGQARWLLGYAIATIIAVGIVPTNILPCGILAGTYALRHLATCKQQAQQDGWRLLSVCVIPFVGFFTYAGVLEKLLKNAREWQTAYTVGGVMTTWGRAISGDVWWLAPFILLGIWQLIREARQDSRWQLTGARLQLSFGMVSVCLPPIFLALPAQVPFPRVLIPVLPLWCTTAACVLAGSFRWLHLRAWHPQAHRIAALGLGLVIITTSVLREQNGADYATRYTNNDKPQSIYDLYYHHDFHPSAAVSALKKISAEHPVVIITDTSDLFALIYVVETRYPRWLSEKNVTFLFIGRLSSIPLSSLARTHRIVLLTHSQTGADQLAKTIRTHAPASFNANRSPSKVADTGYFKIYDCP